MLRSVGWRQRPEGYRMKAGLMQVWRKRCTGWRGWSGSNSDAAAARRAGEAGHEAPSDTNVKGGGGGVSNESRIEMDGQKAAGAAATPEGETTAAPSGASRAAPGAEAGDSASAGGDGAPWEQLLAEREEEMKQWKERSLRLLAEMENVRTIARRDVDTARRYGVASFAREMLDVADNLSRALGAVPRESLSDATKTAPSGHQAADCPSLLAALVEGVAATEREMQNVFRKFQIVQYGRVGDPFDPEVHQALFEAPSPKGGGEGSDGDTSLPEGTILHVMKSGYKIHDRVLRPAEVGVVKNPPTPSNA
eukprot:ctg_934.g358